ncbi:MAG: hypothetical protein LBC56_04520 [Oscillospiraceae bacterium]|jgi:hypothetical protein|nr:hypothetical protein [Oscillospiraceae bacterium]
MDTARFHNPEIIQKSESLSGYSEFVAKVREYQAAGHSLVMWPHLSRENAMNVN